MAEVTEKMLMQKAYDIQDASNLSGVVHEFSRSMRDLFDIAQEKGHGTLWVNRHPMCALFADKIAHLTDTQTIGRNPKLDQAYEFYRYMINGEVDSFDIGMFELEWEDTV